MTIPLLVIALSFISFGRRTIINDAAKENQYITLWDSEQLSSLLNSYRHKAYELSTNEQIISLLSRETATQTIEAQTKKSAYGILFSVMQNETYKASAHILSVDGKLQLSTHMNPSHYNLRSDNTIPTLMLAIKTPDKERSTLTTIQNHYENYSGQKVVLSLMRNVFNEKGSVIGYVIIDIFHTTLLDSLVNTSNLDNLILVDPSIFEGSSLINFSSKIQDYSFFSELSIRDKGDMKKGQWISNGIILTIEPIANTPLFICGCIKLSPYLDSVQTMLTVLLLAFGLGILLSFILARRFTYHVTKPIKVLASSMKMVETSNMTIQFYETDIQEIDQLYRSFNYMVIELIHLIQKTKTEEKEIIEAERKTMEAERISLQSQMNPHFLYNTLNTIKSLAYINKQKDIYTISIKLGELLRATVDNTEAYCDIDTSIQLVQSYLTIQLMRFKDKLHVTYQIDENLMDIITPKLIIQPIVENAIIHGLEKKVGAWNLSIIIQGVSLQNKEYVSIEVVDNGVGFPPGFLPFQPEKLQETKHVGLSNIYRRLHLYYGDDFTLSLFEEEGCSHSLIIIPESIQYKGRNS